MQIVLIFKTSRQVVLFFYNGGADYTSIIGRVSSVFQKYNTRGNPRSRYKFQNHMAPKLYHNFAARVKRVGKNTT